MPRAAAPILLAIAILSAGAGCAATGPADPPTSAAASPTPTAVAEQRVELEGSISKVMAGGQDDHGYVIKGADGTYLALDSPDAVPPLNARGVIVAVPGDVEIPTDKSEVFATLAHYSDISGEPLRVIDFVG